LPRLRQANWASTISVCWTSDDQFLVVCSNAETFIVARLEMASDTADPVRQQQPAFVKFDR
jgi:hypothetical protein